MKRILPSAAVLLLFSGAFAITRAQDDTQKKTHRNTRTLTGCLEKGDNANEYVLTTKKGSTWEIKSDSVNLGEHVGTP